MHFQSVFSLATAVLGAAKCAAYALPNDAVDTRQVEWNQRPTNEVWEMHQPPSSDSRYPTWVATKQAELGMAEELYREANKAFNSIKGESKAKTSSGSLLVAVYYDYDSKTMYASSIPRGGYLTAMRATENNQAPIWQAHYQNLHSTEDIDQSRMDAEDGAYFLKESNSQSNVRPGEGMEHKYKGAIAVWGVQGIGGNGDVGSGGPIKQCDQCAKLARSLGVNMDPPRSGPW